MMKLILAALIILGVAESGVAKPLTAKKIQDGSYWMETSDPRIEVSGDRFFFNAEGETPQPISDLRYVNDGIFFYQDRYWCQSDIPPYNARLENYEKAVCTENGWLSIESSPKSSKQPEYCAPDAYRDFFVHFVRSDSKSRSTYTGSHVEIRNYEQPKQLFSVISNKTYKAFRLAIDGDSISIDTSNRNFYETQPRRNVDARDDRVNLTLSFKKESFVTRLRAQRLARLEFRDISDRSFRVEYSDVRYVRSDSADKVINWIETDGEYGAYVFEHRNDCWYLTQDLRHFY